MLKPASVGISSYIFFKEFRGFTPKASLGISLSASLSAFLIEKINQSKEHWFVKQEQEYSESKLKTLQSLVKMQRVQIAYNILLAFRTVMYGPIQKEIISAMSENKKWFVIVNLIAPIVEEILFRGFFKEMIECGCILVDRHLCKITEDRQHIISNTVQALVFGWIHIQGENKVNDALVFFSTFMMGLIQGQRRRYEQGCLLTPIKLHMFQNMGVTLLAVYLLPALKTMETLSPHQVTPHQPCLDWLS